MPNGDDITFGSDKALWELSRDDLQHLEPVGLVSPIAPSAQVSLRDIDVDALQRFVGCSNEPQEDGQHTCTTPSTP